MAIRQKLVFTPYTFRLWKDNYDVVVRHRSILSTRYASSRRERSQWLHIPNADCLSIVFLSNSVWSESPAVNRIVNGSNPFSGSNR